MPLTPLRILLALHGLIHGLGFAAAFGLVPLPALSRPVPRPSGLVWLAVSIACLVVAAWLGAAPLTRAPWWCAGLLLCASQALIISAWPDAKAGTLVNLLLALGLWSGSRYAGPASFRAELAARAVALRDGGHGAPIAESELLALPEPVRRYLRVTHALTRPARYAPSFRGRIRGAPSEAWMPFTAQQLSRVAPPERLFLMEARMHGLPVQAFHHYTPEGATFRVRIAGLVDLVNAHGPQLTRAETVTVLNDMCLLAPGSLVDPALRWEARDAAHARVHFHAGAQHVSAELTFDPETGELVDFVSDDRLRASADGTRFTSLRFSTPVRDYRPCGDVTLMHVGEARWHAPAPEGEFAYGELELVDLRYE